MLERGFIQLGLNQVLAYDLAGLKIPVQPIPELVQINAGAIERNSEVTIPLTDLEFSILPLSLWVDVVSGTNDRINFFILRNGEEIFAASLNSSQVPFEFPPAVLTPELSLKFRTRNAAINNAIVFARPANVIQVINPPAPGP